MSFITDNAPLVTGLISAILVLVVQFGIPVTTDQRNAIDGVVVAIIALLAVYANKVTVPKTLRRGASAKSIQQPK